MIILLYLYYIPLKIPFTIISYIYHMSIIYLPKETIRDISTKFIYNKPIIFTLTVSDKAVNLYVKKLYIFV